MLDAHPRRWARPLTLAAALVFGLVSATVPVTPPAEAAALPDLTVVTGSTNITVKAGQAFTHVYYVRNLGAGDVPAGQAVAKFTLPDGFGFTITQVSAIGPLLWDCTHTPTVATCTNRSPMTIGQYPTRIRIDATVAQRSPTTTAATSAIDPNRRVTESNEQNNTLLTIINITN